MKLRKNGNITSTRIGPQKTFWRKKNFLCLFSVRLSKCKVSRAVLVVLFEIISLTTNNLFGEKRIFYANYRLG